MACFAGCIWLAHAAKLPPGERIAAIDKLRPDVAALYSGTAVADSSGRILARAFITWIVVRNG